MRPRWHERWTTLYRGINKNALFWRGLWNRVIFLLHCCCPSPHLVQLETVNSSYLFLPMPLRSFPRRWETKNCRSKKAMWWPLTNHVSERTACVHVWLVTIHLWPTYSYFSAIWFPIKTDHCPEAVFHFFYFVLFANVYRISPLLLTMQFLVSAAFLTGYSSVVRRFNSRKSLIRIQVNFYKIHVPFVTVHSHFAHIVFINYEQLHIQFIILWHSYNISC